MDTVAAHRLGPQGRTAHGPGPVRCSADRRPAVQAVPLSRIPARLHFDCTIASRHLKIEAMSTDPNLHRYAAAIRARELTIYDPISVGDPDLWIPLAELESILRSALQGADLGGLPLRTRSKAAKELVCRALGYPIPRSFRKTRPRFPGQRFDTYVQKANNLQIWNEAIDPGRRYVLIGLDRDDTVVSVRAVSGSAIAALDKTGTLTRKYQARMTSGDRKSELASQADTARVRPLLPLTHRPTTSRRPNSAPTPGHIFPIAELFSKLRGLVGTALPDAAKSQERLRGALLHAQACRALAYDTYGDDGQFPDIRNQLLEVKLQLSPTIDLGLLRPDSEETLEALQCGDTLLRPRDVRYAVFGASLYGPHILLTSLCLVTGRDFPARFPLMEGKGINRKLQLSLPADFFNQ